MHSVHKEESTPKAARTADLTRQKLMQTGQTGAPLQREQDFTRRVRSLQRFTARPVGTQRAVAAPALTAAALHSAEVKRLQRERDTLQHQVADLGRAGTALPAGLSDQTLQRQPQQASAQAALPVSPPCSSGDWVTVMRQQAEQVEGCRLDSRAMAQFTALQRQVAQHLTAAYRQDRQPAPARTAEYAAHLAALQRHPVSEPVARAVLTQVPAGERATLQRAVDDLRVQEAMQRQQEEQVLALHSLQRQLAELDEQAAVPVMDRIQQRRGSGNPLPAAVQRHLEQGLNHDLSAVRIHDDAEADKLAKGVNATAFTTGRDIYFRSGKFNPNTSVPDILPSSRAWRVKWRAQQPDQCG